MKYMFRPDSIIKKWIYSQEFQKERELILFFVKLFLIWLSWKGVFWLLGEEKTPIEERVIPALSAVWENFNLWLVKGLLLTSKMVLNLLGFSSHITGRSIWIEHVHAVGVGNYCLGMQLIYYNTFLIIITKASWKRKVIAILTGILITQILNIFRVVGLSLLAFYKPEWVEFAHDHIFNVMVFGTMIGFYYFYLVKKQK